MDPKKFYVLGEDAQEGDLLEANPINGVLQVVQDREIVKERGVVINMAGQNAE